MYSNIILPILYRYDLENREGCDVMAHERLTEPRFIID